MSKLFWEPLVEIEEIELKIDEHGLVKEQKLHLLEITHQTYGIKIVDIVLSHLPKEKHKPFLDKYADKSHHPNLLDWLKEEVEDIEEKIKELTGKVKKEILDELHKI